MDRSLKSKISKIVLKCTMKNEASYQEFQEKNAMPPPFVNLLILPPTIPDANHIELKIIQRS